MSYSTEVCVFCPGGFGTLNELFEILTLQQTNKIGNIPVILFISDFWNPIQETIKTVLLEKFKTVSPDDMNLYMIMDDEDTILEVIKTSKLRNGEDSFK
jgi:predicted Rossmann-fold nucleotide-binding protein